MGTLLICIVLSDEDLMYPLSYGFIKMETKKCSVKVFITYILHIFYRVGQNWTDISGAALSAEIVKCLHLDYLPIIIY